MSGTSLSYNLRPNKVIDRMVFLELLMRLNKLCSISNYQYIGFGSFYFEEFKLLHKQLCIKDMVSLEANENVYKRQLFNRPYDCIKTILKTSTSYIEEDFEREKPVIIWLDYTEAYSLREQINEFCSLIGRLYSKDILRITLNANPNALKKVSNPKSNIQNERLGVLRERIGDYLPMPIDKKLIDHKEYPKTLLASIRNAIYKLYKLSNKQFLPLSACTYADGHQMLTLTGIIYNKSDERKEIEETLNDWEYFTGSWEVYNEIAIPSLTPKERILLNEKMPGTGIEEICKLFDYTFNDNQEIEESIRNYIKYYRYYPNFHQVIF